MAQSNYITGLHGPVVNKIWDYNPGLSDAVCDCVTTDLVTIGKSTTGHDKQPEF